jgi:hypothetical protein
MAAIHRRHWDHRVRWTQGSACRRSTSDDYQMLRPRARQLGTCKIHNFTPAFSLFIV